MTPLATLQKYGLKTDVKSVKERMLNWDYSRVGDKTIEKSLRTADLALLCELAEIGERLSTPPTADEVCEEIKKYLDNYDEDYKKYKVRYTYENIGKRYFEAYYIDKDNYSISETICGIFRGSIDFDFCVLVTDMKLATLVTRYFEGETK